MVIFNTISIKCATAAAIVAIATVSAADEAKMNYTIDVVAQNYTDKEGVLLQGFLSLPKDYSGNSISNVPAVVILHDSDGPDAYEQQRATMIANDLGYAGFAADIFGVNTEIPVNTGGWGGPYAEFIDTFRNNATLFTQRIAAAVEHVQSLPNVDANKVSLVGYCLGGTGVVHYLNNAGDDEGGASAAVSIHPTLLGSWEGPTGEINIPSLFLTGGADFLTGPQAMASLEEDMSNFSTVKWETTRYAKIDHAFTNWFTENYNERADTRSWESMKSFLGSKFPYYFWQLASQLNVPDSIQEQVFPASSSNEGDGSGYKVKISDVSSGYFAKPYKDSKVGEEVPAVVILPHGKDDLTFARQRAMQIAKLYGYAALVAYDNSMVTDAIQYLKGVMIVDSKKIAVEGYGNGGSSALSYAMGSNGEDIKVFSSFHGNLTELEEVSAEESEEGSAEAWGGGSVGDWEVDSAEAFNFSGSTEAWSTGSSEAWEQGSAEAWNPPAATEKSNTASKPQILISSGVDGDAMADVIKLENALMEMDANYEISRYSDTKGGFTNWNHNYNADSAGRSFEALESIYREVFGAFPVDVETTPPIEESKPPTSPPTSGAKTPAAVTITSYACLLATVNILLI